MRLPERPDLRFWQCRCPCSLVNNVTLYITLLGWLKVEDAVMMTLIDGVFQVSSFELRLEYPSSDPSCLYLAMVVFLRCYLVEGIASSLPGHNLHDENS